MTKEHEVVMEVIQAMQLSLTEAGGPFPIADFEWEDADLAESGEGLDMVGFASSVWPSYFNDAATDQAKWPEYHLSFCQSVNVKWPVDIGVFANLSPHTLSAAYPDIGALPQRERDMYFVVDQLVSNGSGSGETGGGQRVYLDASQALPRKPISFDVLGVILPGSKFIDMHTKKLIHPRTLANLMGVVSSFDVSLQAVLGSVSLRLLADLCGNAMCGWSFGECVLQAFATSTSRCRFRASVRAYLKFGALLEAAFNRVRHDADSCNHCDSLDSLVAPPKRRKTNSALGDLLSLA